MRDWRKNRIIKAFVLDNGGSFDSDGFIHFPREFIEQNGFRDGEIFIQIDKHKWNLLMEGRDYEVD